MGAGPAGEGLHFLWSRTWGREGTVPPWTAGYPSHLYLCFEHLTLRACWTMEAGISAPSTHFPEGHSEAWAGSISSSTPSWLSWPLPNSPPPTAGSPPLSPRFCVHHRGTLTSSNNSSTHSIYPASVTIPSTSHTLAPRIPILALETRFTDERRRHQAKQFTHLPKLTQLRGGLTRTECRLFGPRGMYPSSYQTQNLSCCVCATESRSL